MAAKQIEYEKKQSLIAEAERAFELMGRAIRMAGYQNGKIKNQYKNSDPSRLIWVNKKEGYRESDSLSVQHELSDGVDFDCIGNSLSKERTRNNLAFQGFSVARQAGIPKGVKVNGGSLICHSLDRQGRLQNTTLMNGVNQLLVQEIHVDQGSAGKRGKGDQGQRLYRLTLQMSDGAQILINLERTFSTRNLP